MLCKVCIRCQNCAFRSKYILRKLHLFCLKRLYFRIAAIPICMFLFFAIVYIFIVKYSSIFCLLIQTKCRTKGRFSITSLKLTTLFCQIWPMKFCGLYIFSLLSKLFPHCFSCSANPFFYLLKPPGSHFHEFLKSLMI